MNFRHLLVPMDFGAASEQALELALSLASSFGADLTLLHVSPAPPSSYATYAPGAYWPVDEIARASAAALDRDLARARERIPSARGELASGEPWHRIIDFAQAHGVDLIVMGTHGRRGVSRVLLGSVADKVVRLAHVPVITVPAAEAAPIAA